MGLVTTAIVAIFTRKTNKWNYVPTTTAYAYAYRKAT
jgi:hypothetical protein